MVAHVFEAERALGRVHALILENQRSSEVIKANPQRLFLRRGLRGSEEGGCLDFGTSGEMLGE